MKSKKELEVANRGLKLCFLVGWIGFGFVTIISFFGNRPENIPILIFLGVSVLMLLICILMLKMV